MNKVRLRVVLVELVALSLLASALAVPAIAEEEYGYVLTLDSPDWASNTYFGYSIAVGEDIIVVGEVYSTVEGYYHAGKAYIYDFDGNLKASLQSTTPMIEAVFGYSVAFDGETIIVGEHLVEVDGIEGAGRVNIFDLEGNLKATLSSLEPAYLGRFGKVVAINGDKIVVSESGATFGEYLHAGRVHVYDLEGNLLTTLQSPEPFEGGGSGGNFGFSLDFNGNIIVVGEVHTTVDDIVAAGRVFVFNYNGDLLASLKSPEPQIGGEFGQSVAVNNDVVIVGEHCADVEGYEKAGKVHVFDLEGDLLYTLQSPEPGEVATFGRKVAVTEELIIVGERGADGATEREGRVRLYDMDGNYITSLKAPQSTTDAEFGSSFAVGGDTIVVGERSVVGGEFKAGRVYLFRLGVAAFTSSGLNIDPSSVDVGGTVTISVEVTNTGAKSGTHTVALMIDGEVEDETTVTVNPDESETVSFQVSAAEQGSYSVEVDGLTGSYTVTEPKKEERIPGFPYEAIILGLMTGIFMIWLLQRRH